MQYTTADIGCCLQVDDSMYQLFELILNGSTMEWDDGA
jgi:hypothetical protein